VNEQRDYRVVFFLVAAVICALLAPVAPGEFVNVCLITAGVYVLLAAASALDRWSRSRYVERSRQDRRQQ
jgi:hypothetical protein